MSDNEEAWRQEEEIEAEHEKYGCQICRFNDEFVVDGHCERCNKTTVIAQSFEQTEYWYKHTYNAVAVMLWDKLLRKSIRGQDFSTREWVFVYFIAAMLAFIAYCTLTIDHRFGYLEFILFGLPTPKFFWRFSMDGINE